MILNSTFHDKGWGSEEWIINSPLYCAKILRVRAGKKCSLHTHTLKTETMLVVEGMILMRYGHELENLAEVRLSPGMAFHIAPGLIHQFEAVSNSTIHEFSTEHFESDSYRLVKGD